MIPFCFEHLTQRKESKYDLRHQHRVSVQRFETYYMKNSSLPFGRGSRVNGRGSKNPPQLFLNVVKSKFRVYSSFRCLFYFYVNT